MNIKELLKSESNSEIVEHISEKIRVVEEEYNMRELARVFEVSSIKTTLGKHSAFLMSLVCKMNINWTFETNSIQTDGVDLWINPDFFTNIPSKARTTVLMHELMHIAFMHNVRAGTRDIEKWNLACDIKINSLLEEDGFSFEGLENNYEHIDARNLFNSEHSEEDIYDYLKQNDIDPDPNKDGFGQPNLQSSQAPPSSGNEGSDNNGSRNGNNNSSNGSSNPNSNPNGDLKVPFGGMDNSKKQEAIGNVTQSMQQAKMSRQWSDLAGYVKTILDEFNKPKVDWETALTAFLQDLGDEDYSWLKRNRRFEDIYLPALVEDENRLDTLNYYFDVSGSVSDDDVNQFNSEVKYVFDTFRPKKVNIITFDTSIRDVYTYTEYDEYEPLEIEGRGGTCLVDVRNHILEEQPTAAIIFSDLYCDPMEPFEDGIPLVWIVLDHPEASVFDGDVIHIDSISNY